jgi:signal transduction histidine kinase/ligand-binding sensor protein
MRYKFSDLVDVAGFQKTMQSLYTVTGIPHGLSDAQGRILFSVGWRDFCVNRLKKKEGIDCACRQSFRFMQEPGGDPFCVGYKCVNSLLCYASPLMVGGQQVAVLFAGQLLHEPLDKDIFRHQAREFGFDEDDYLEALNSVPVISETQARDFMGLLVQIAQSFTEKGLERQRMLKKVASLEKTAEMTNKSREKLEAQINQGKADLAEAKKAFIDEIVVHERVVEDLKQLNTELRASQERTALMLHSVQMASGSLELNQVLERIAEMLASATGMPHCGIYLMDEEQNVLIRHAGTKNLSGEQLAMMKNLLIDPAQFPLVQEALDKKKSILCQDATTDTRVNLQILPPLDFRSMLIVPIQMSDRVLGVALNYTLGKSHTFTREGVELASGVANSVALAVENARLYGEIRQRLAESQGIQRVTTSLLRKNSLAEVLEIICNEALNLTDGTESAVMLLERDGWLRVTSAVTGGVFSSLDRLPIDGTLAGQAASTGEPMLINNVTSLGLGYLKDLDIKTIIAAPLKVDTTIIGVLDVINKVGGFTKDDLRIISLFADQAAIVIDHTQLHQQVEKMAVMEERQRLARELHDSVTQALYSANLYAEAARMSLSAGKKSVTLENLQRLREMTREAMLDMRSLVFELHPLVLEKEGLAVALQTRLAAVEGRAGVKTEIQVEGEGQLPLAIEEEIYRIAQEGLNNVVKHARAKSVRIGLKFGEQSVCLELWDDGTGFDPETAGASGGMGLHGIEERVRKIGGTLSLESSPGGGTRLSVLVPLVR